MSAKLLYRIASVLFIIFALSHTFGVLSQKAPSSPAAAVRAAMDHVRWRFMGSEISYGGMYIGFGLFVTAALLLAALFAWHLGSLSATHPQAIGLMGWSLFAFSLACLILGWIYFFAGPIVVSALLALSLGGAAITGHSTRT